MLAALALPACGENDVPVDTDKTFLARQTLQNFLSLCAQGRGLPAFEILNEPAAEVFLDAPNAEAGCDRILQLTPPGDDAEQADLSRLGARDYFREARIVELKVTGGLAEAMLRARDEESTVELEDTGERWLLTNAHLPLP